VIETFTEIRILYAHTDKMGVVNNVRYFEYFEAGRNDFLRKLGYPYTELEKKNYGLPVIEAFSKFYSGAKYDDIITVNTFLENIPTVRFRINYKVFLSEKIIAEGYTVHSFVNFQKMKASKPPEDFIKLIREKLLIK